MIVTLLVPQKAQAIPAFTRQHKTECFTCHTIFPELTEQGDNFRRNSYVWLETGAGAKPAPSKDPKKNDKKGLNEREYLTLSSIPDYLPLSIAGTFNASYADYRKEGDGNKFDLATRAIVLDAGGSFNDKMGVWISYNLYSEGIYNHTTSSAMNANVPSNNIPDLNEAFLQARHLFKTPLNIKLGRFTPTLSLWKTTNKTSLISPLATTSYRTGDSPFYTNAATDGIEFNSILGGRFAVATGVVKHKDQKNLSGFGSVHFKIGGADFEGHEKPVNLDAEDSIFDFLSLTLGTYGYAGANNPGTYKQLNNYYRFGFEGDARYKRFRFKAASAFGNDDNPVVSSGVTAGNHLERSSRVYAAEALYLLGSEIIPSLRYEYEDSGFSISRRIIPTVAYAPLQNAKLVLEYKWESISGIARDNNTINLGLTASF
jgi:hypothetical protein